MNLIDYEELQRRLILVPNLSFSGSFAIGHLVDQLRYLDVAVEDLERAELEFAAAAAARAVGATQGEAHERFVRAAIRLHYRFDSAYGIARRVLDRAVVVVNQLLPRTQTDLGNSHTRFGTLLERRCAELGLPVPEPLLIQIADLTERIKTVRDRLEHPTTPLSMRSIDATEGLTVGMHNVVPAGSDPVETRFEPAGVLRAEIHEYVLALADLLEAPRTSQ